MTRPGLAAALAALALGQPAPAAGEPGDGARGQELFRRCVSCHQVGPGARNRIGPHLNGIVGRAAAGVEGFRYSDGLARAGAEGLAWDGEALDAFIRDPRAFVRGTRMSYAGMKDAADRADLLAYLRALPADPRGAEAARPAVDPAVLAIEGDAEYGDYLSSECATCHGPDGAGGGIPPIAGWSEDQFVAVMHGYRDGTRAHPVMRMIAGRLGDDEIAALAAHFARKGE